MAEYRGINGVARRISKEYRGVNGVARKIVKAYRGINGVARRYYSASPYKIRKDLITASTDTSIDSSSYITGGKGTLTVYLKSNNGSSEASSTFNRVYCGIMVEDDSGSLAGKTVSFNVESYKYSGNFHCNFDVWGSSKNINDTFTSRGNKSYIIPEGATFFKIGIRARYSDSGTLKITDLKIDGETVDLSL